MRLDDPRLAGAGRPRPAGCRRSSRSSRSRPTIGCSSRPPCSRTARSGHVHRKLFLPTYGLFDERRFFAAGDLLRAVPSRLGTGHRDRHLRGLLAPVRAAAAGPRRRPDPGQRVVVAGSRPGRDQRGRPRDGDVVADADADLRAADDVVRRLLQPGRGGRVDLVLGRLGGHRAERAGRLQRAALRRGPVHGRHRARPTSAASGSPCRCCATSARSSTSASSGGSWPSGPAWPPTRRPRPAPKPGLDVVPAEPPREPIGFEVRTRADRVRSTAAHDVTGPASRPVRRRRAVRAAGRAGDRHRRRPPGHRRVHPRPARAGRLRASGARAVGRDRLGARRLPRGRGDRRRPAARGPDAVPDVVAGVARRRGDGRRRPRLCRASSSRSAPMVDGYFGTERRPGASGAEGLTASALRRGNFAARMRMAVLYDRSVTWGGLVVGTGNKTESLIGYTTLFGDSACAFNPIGDLYKSQVRQLAVAVGVPDAIVRKAPSADLWPGQTDEAEGGFSYPVLDRLLFWRVDKRRSIEEMVGARLRCGDRRAGRPDGRRRRVQAPGPADRQARAADRRRGLPLPAPPAGVGARVTRRDRRRRGDGRRRRPAAATRRPVSSSATPIGNLGDVTLRALDGPAGGAAHRRRGHAPHDAACSTATTIATRTTSYHARSGPARPAALLEHLRGGADLALVTDAGTPGRQRPGRRAGGRLGGGGRQRSCRSRAHRAVLAAVAGVRGRRAALDVRGLPAAERARAARAARPDRRRRARDGPVRGARPRRGHPARPRRGLRRGAAGGRLPRADQAPRDDRARLARRAGRGRGGRCAETVPHPVTRRVRAGRRGVARRCRRRPPRTRRRASTPRGPRSRRSSRPASRAARRHAGSLRTTGLPRRRLYGARRASVGWPDDISDRTDGAPRPACRSSGQLSMLARVSLIVTVVLSLLAIVLDFGLHADPTVLFVIVGGGDPRPRLGRRPVDRAARIADRAAGRRHPQRDVRQHRRADHRVLRAAGRSHRGRQGVADRLDHRQPAAGHGGQRAHRRPAPRHPDVQRQDRVQRTSRCSCWPSSGCSCRRSSR